MSAMDRRRFLGAAVGLAAAGAPVIGAAARLREPTAALTPFTLGVSSGSPTPDGFVLWTKLAPTPMAPDGLSGLTDPVSVRWEVGLDEGMRRIVRSDRAMADARLGHSVHVEVGGLPANRPYWYRFTAQGHQSGVGRTRTAPALGAAAPQLNFGFVSCSNYELGYFSAYRHLAEENPDLVLYLGDYIYEYSNVRDWGNPQRVARQHDRREECSDLPSYRNRYSLYQQDADLQRVMACAPSIVTWDDHEVQNDYSNQWSQDPTIPPDAFLARRAAAYQAFYEHQPVRRSSMFHGPSMQVYGAAQWGTLVDFSVLDGRQYRSMQPCPTPTTRAGHLAPLSCPDLIDEHRTMLGYPQERWLYERFRHGRGQWTIVAQDLLVARLFQTQRDGTPGQFTDGWDGYGPNRSRMLTALAQSQAKNPVFLGGDIHSYWATDLKADYENPSSRTVGTEFVGAAIAQRPSVNLAGLQAHNPHVIFSDCNTNGYATVKVTPQRLETQFRAISNRFDRETTVSTLKAFAVEDGRPGVNVL